MRRDGTDTPLYRASERLLDRFTHGIPAFSRTVKMLCQARGEGLEWSEAVAVVRNAWTGLEKLSNETIDLDELLECAAALAAHLEGRETRGRENGDGTRDDAEGS